MGRIKYLLDSNICIHFIKNDFNIPAKISSVGVENCFISELTILELMYGIANSTSTKKEENRLKLKQFTESFQNRVLPIRPVFEIFAEQKTRLRRIGTPISDFDLLIGCTAILEDCVLVSRNVKEMMRIEGLVYENWID
ncbi:PIN domain-containing protein [Arcicella lustrica]|uniref:PIN domain-containing protein n=1 Tax=Arcicella lustrica TaxID=2984196 RepID=A0ABU5SNY9_9BACT|nr:PIN domain-containing protein [Arcicella sp. DC25W]MEA5429033.1 PIN domain-containing protein [Arcicella sp. DC25W]